MQPKPATELWEDRWRRPCQRPQAPALCSEQRTAPERRLQVVGRAGSPAEVLGWDTGQWSPPGRDGNREVSASPEVDEAN